jgi:lycopene beta-cyclase
MNKIYDFIIIGAGCAGLSLAYRLRDKKFKICLIESSSNINLINKTWSFWNTYDTPFNHLVRKKWDQMVIRNNNETKKINCSKFNYQSIDSKEFNNFVLEEIDRNKNIDIKYMSNVLDIIVNKNNVKVLTKEATYECDHVFDSRPHSREIYMWQQFYGVYVKTKEDIFEDNTAILMDFSKLENKFHFMYVLPFSKNTALIESTYFSSNKETKFLDDKYIESYMASEYKDAEYRIEKKEHGSIPMDPTISNLSNTHITKIGAYSGVTRASTGYTFINIQKQLDGITERIEIGQNNACRTDKYFHSFVLRKMDSIFLKIIKENPAYMKAALISLFSGKNHNPQIKFLSDIPDIIDIIKIIIHLPKLKFLKYALGLNDKKNR